MEQSSTKSEQLTSQFYGVRLAVGTVAFSSGNLSYTERV